jgi:creatinine amidohydrolase/Fe(II)-dependent formamide hydrolase-like protein
VGALAANGVLGDPRGASAALGDRCIDAVIDLLADHFDSRAAGAGK